MWMHDDLPMKRSSAWERLSLRFRERAPAALQLARRSLLLQFVSAYIVFVLIILATGAEADHIAQRQFQSAIQTSDVALAQQIAFDTNSRLTGVESSLMALSQLAVVRAGVSDDMRETFQAFRIARHDVDQVYWLDPTGALRVSVPVNLRTLGANFSADPLFQRAILTRNVVIEADVVDLTTFNADISFSVALRDAHGALLGVLGASVLLDELNIPIQSVMNAQSAQSQSLRITILDNEGKIIASQERERLLQYATSLLPGASQALRGRIATATGTDASGTEWLYSSVPISGAGWAVVVQRPTSDLAAEASDFRNWLAIATGLVALGGLLFWLILVWRVVRPLHILTAEHAALVERNGREGGVSRNHGNALTLARRGAPGSLMRRADEIGSLARTLGQLRWDISMQLAELRTLLVTSNAVVRSLDPQKVGMDIIREVRRLLDVQAAAVLAPDDRGGLRTLAWQGCEPLTLTPAQALRQGLTQPVARALHDGQPMQMIADGNPTFPERSYRQGFRSVLALPIVTERVGTVVLEVQRTQPVAFSENEINLLLTFANYAALAWEHAALYEHTDERLRSTAQENARLYQQANAERQTLAAIMSSISDGLLLASASGEALYANPGAHALISLPESDLGSISISDVHEALAATAEQPERYRRDMARAQASGARQWLLETSRAHGGQVYAVRMFEVRDEEGEAIGQGLLLRDITREQEVDQFKSALLAAVGHELRTPLAAIKGHASTLLQDDVHWTVEDQRHFLRTISEEADRMAQMISNLLDLSRLEAGLLLLRRSPHNLAQLAEEAIRRLRVEDGAILLEIEPDLPLVQVDAARIEVTLRNLLANALAYGAGPVRLRARGEGGAMVLVEVADSGPGIADEDLPHVFERFYRASHGRRRSESGAGLGLAICKAFVEAHGGRIWARNRDAGAVLAFTLPLAGGAADPDVALEVGSDVESASVSRGV